MSGTETILLLGLLLLGLISLAGLGLAGFNYNAFRQFKQDMFEWSNTIADRTEMQEALSEFPNQYVSRVAFDQLNPTTPNGIGRLNQDLQDLTNRVGKIERTPAPASSLGLPRTSRTPPPPPSSEVNTLKRQIRELHESLIKVVETLGEDEEALHDRFNAVKNEKEALLKDLRERIGEAIQAKNAVPAPGKMLDLDLPEDDRVDILSGMAKKEGITGALALMKRVGELDAEWADIVTDHNAPIKAAVQAFDDAVQVVKDAEWALKDAKKAPAYVECEKELIELDRRLDKVKALRNLVKPLVSTGLSTAPQSPPARRNTLHGPPSTRPPGS